MKPNFKLSGSWFLIVYLLFILSIGVFNYLDADRNTKNAIRLREMFEQNMAMQKRYETTLNWVSKIALVNGKVAQYTNLQDSTNHIYAEYMNGQSYYRDYLQALSISRSYYRNVLKPLLDSLNQP